MPKPSLLKTSIGTTCEDKGVYAFPKSISPKVNVTTRAEFELAYHDSAIQLFFITSRGQPLINLVWFICLTAYQLLI